MPNVVAVEMEKILGYKKKKMEVRMQNQAVPNPLYVPISVTLIMNHLVKDQPNQAVANLVEVEVLVLDAVAVVPWSLPMPMLNHLLKIE